jgi:CHAT domain-containing protein
MRSVAGVVVREEVPESEWMFRREDSATDGPALLHRSRARWLLDIGPRGQLSRSALLLAGFNTWLAGAPTAGAVGTGMLTAGEFALLDLAGTELVVLSACETGVGAVDAADGSLLGLRTAALAAGAASCVSTLWNVEDDAATAAMSAFYRQLGEGDDPARALRTAQLRLRSANADPYFWAAWVVEGSVERVRLS